MGKSGGDEANTTLGRGIQSKPHAHDNENEIKLNNRDK
jgi:hypothetical protein